MQKNAVTIAYEYIQQRIFTGEWPLGSPISESQIAHELGLSRSPIREALKKMEFEGIVNHYYAKGSFVAQITAQDVEEIFELRLLIELLALKTSYNLIPKEDLIAVKETFLSLTASSVPDQYHAANKTLHSMIVHYGTSSRLKNYYTMVSSINTFMTRIVAKDPDHFPNSRIEHLAITEALLNRDYVAAECELSRHIRGIKEKTARMCGVFR